MHIASRRVSTSWNRKNKISVKSVTAAASDRVRTDPFVDYYEKQSLTPEAVERFRRVKALVMRVRTSANAESRNLDVADIGCNAGTQMLIWGEEEHNVFGLEINAELIEIARERCAEAGLHVSLAHGTATEMPWPDASMDVCLMPELLEHVTDWRTCLTEAVRVLRPGGVLYLSTTNKLCPRQMEYDLPLYSWYPGRLKRHYEKVAVTSRPELVNHATYPAVNWFTPYQLISELDRLGMDAHDHLSFVDANEKGRVGRALLSVVQNVGAARFFAHIATPYSMILGVKR